MAIPTHLATALHAAPLNLLKNEASSRSKSSRHRRALSMAVSRAGGAEKNGHDVVTNLRSQCASGSVKCGMIAAAAAAILSTTVPFAAPDVAMAYLGGGPYGREVTRGQDLTGRDFSGLDLNGQDFKTSILRQANFRGARLVGASFFDADLFKADFSGADLTGADFSLASAVKANFENAILEGVLVTGNTSFQGANIAGADFTEAFFRADQKEYLCKVATGVNPVTGNETRETLLC